MLTPTSQVNTKVAFLVLSVYLKVKVLVVQPCPTFAAPSVDCQALLSMEFSRQEYQSGFHLQGIFLTQGSNPGLLHCGQTLYPLNHQKSSEQVPKEIIMFWAQFPERCRWIECVSLSSWQYFCLKKKKSMWSFR